MRLYIKKRLKPCGDFIRRHHVILLSFILPALILEIAYASRGIFPFGKWNVFIIDLFHQYAPFISDLQDKLGSFSSFLYSWTGGLGTSYLPQYAYYLASPLNLITVLFPKNCLSEAVLILTLLKVGLAGGFFALYLRGVHREQSLAATAFSLLYALSGYVLVFSWNIMWLDTIYLLPLVILGLHRIVRKGHGILYCIAMAMTIFANFYMAFFVGLFTVLYFIVCLFQHHRIKNLRLLFKRSVQFAGYSLLSAGLSALLLLPTFFALKTTSASGDMFPRTVTHYFDLFDFITRHFTIPSPSIREGMPNLYCGIIVLILIPVYYLSKRIRLKEKLLDTALLLLLIVSFNVNVLNFIWHGLHYPNQIPYRFSFVYVFLVLSMSYKAFRNLKEFTGKQIGAICLSLLGLIILSQKFEDISLELLTFYISIVFVIVYAAAFALDRLNYSFNHTRILFLVCAIITEMVTNSVLTMVRIDEIEGYAVRDGYSNGKEVAEIREQIKKIFAEDKSFYRMEILPHKTVNDPYLYNYRGFTIFSSTSPEKPVRMFENLGYHSNGINSYTYEGSTPILDSLFGIKYLIYRSINIEERLYQEVAKTEELTIFKNPYALSLGIQGSAELKNFHSSSTNPFDAQNRLMEKLSGVKNILVPVDQKQGALSNLTYSSSGTKYYSFKRPNKDASSTAKVQIIVDKDQDVYLYYKTPSGMKGSGFVMVNDKKVEFNARHSTMINLGFLKSGTVAELQLTFDKESPESGRFEVYASGLDLPAFEKAMEIIRKKSMTVESFTDTRIRGRIEAEEDGLMLMSIPYDKGWHVKVDGQEVETQTLDDCLLSFEIAKGSHQVELRFIPDKLKLGMIITPLSILILALIVFRRVRISAAGKFKSRNPEMST